MWRLRSLLVICAMVIASTARAQVPPQPEPPAAQLPPSEKPIEPLPSIIIPPPTAGDPKAPYLPPTTAPAQPLEATPAEPKAEPAAPIPKPPRAKPPKPKVVQRTEPGVEQEVVAETAKPPSFRCFVRDVMAFYDRTHVRCYNKRGAINFFAVDTSQPIAATVLYKALSGMQNGKPVTITYAPGSDLNPSNCNKENCRRLLDIRN